MVDNEQLCGELQFLHSTQRRPTISALSLTTSLVSRETGGVKNKLCYFTRRCVRKSAGEDDAVTQIFHAGRHPGKRREYATSQTQYLLAGHGDSVHNLTAEIEKEAAQAHYEREGCRKVHISSCICTSVHTHGRLLGLRERWKRFEI
ncbi:hypothetical protein BaRGS_00018389 [Batillaria attramentaria]|uniref:Uncharacterized protein n=1 Tax=Batillaria attramentaria TaxID=370345 RepID=A0ABD0KTA6_9CAEN